ncbi:MAG: hypothetical protein OXR66_03725 [Candidatus Woesearchaeota archaeon]|nr:hypothetical protein [Candidatus Woesearchaeota archaeon]
MNNEDKVRATILYNLRRKKVLGGVHTHFDTLKKGFPAHAKKDVKNVAKALVKEQLLLTKPTSYGLQVSLNKEKLKEIDEFIMNILGFEF